jgi:hypothetical protein
LPVALRNKAVDAVQCVVAFGKQLLQIGWRGYYCTARPAASWSNRSWLIKFVTRL